MSYTAPDYVDTKEQAVLALASTIKGEAVTGGDGSVNRALDILADVLAEQDVQVPQTDAGAILALAQYVSGGGGGGSQTVDMYLWDTTTGGSNLLPTKVEYLSAISGGSNVFTELQIEPVTETYSGMTMHGVLVKECPCGALFKLTPPSGYEVSQCKFGWNAAAFPPTGANFENIAPMPLDGMVVSGFFKMVSAS